MFGWVVNALTATPPTARVEGGRVIFSHRGRTVRAVIADLDEIGILTTADGPFQDDVFWVLRSGGKNVLIPWNVDGASALLEAFQALPGFDNDVVVAASGSTEPAAFQAWARRDGPWSKPRT